MRHFSSAAVSLCVAIVAACSSLPPDQQAKIQQALVVTCNVDGVVVPIAQPVVATLGAGGATAATLDSLLVHPAVVAACNAVNGTPASATVVSPPVTGPTNPPATK